MITELQNKKLLVICESPNKVSHISEYLKKAGYKNIKVLASVGHIMELANGGSYYNSGIEPTKDFELNLQIAPDKHDVVNKLKAQVKESDLVYLFTDGDREGEAIAWSLIKFLKIPAKKCRRAITHEITPKAVVNAIENPIELNEALVDSALARLTLDKMVGFRMSPIAKAIVGAKSVGRCQSAGLKLIVDREKEIQNFIPEDYFDLYLNFKKNKTKFRAKYIGSTKGRVEHFKTKGEVKKVMLECINDFIIADISKQEKQESPKPPFCTATFQQEVSSKLGLSVKDTMSVAQKLFESGKITYHRTDDTTISPEFIPALKSFIDTAYGNNVFTMPRKGKAADNAQEGHECLRVTDPTLTPELYEAADPNSLNRKVYKIIWQRTIAAAMPNAIISETAYTISNNNHYFELISNEIVSDGFKKVYSYKDDDIEEIGAVKETFKINEKLKSTSLEDVAKKTQPKSRFKESTFIKELQKREIGRPSTYATIVETILSKARGYCELDEKKCLVPTERGIQLIDFLDRDFSNIINIEYTKEMEKKLDLIANNKVKKLDFLTEFYNNLEDAITKKANFIPNNTKQIVCPKCGAPMVVRRSRYGKLFYGCSKYPQCTGIVNMNSY